MRIDGSTKIVVKSAVRCECENCGEPATNKNTYLMPQPRSNRASSAYGKDDIGWCSDHSQLLCDACQPNKQGIGVPDDYGWCATFTFGGRFNHMFFEWAEREATVSDLKSALASVDEHRNIRRTA